MCCATPLAAALAGLLALAWLTAPASSAWLGEPKTLAAGDGFRWSLLLHLAVAWPGLAIYLAAAPLLVWRGRRANRPTRPPDPRR